MIVYGGFCLYTLPSIFKFLKYSGKKIEEYYENDESSENENENENQTYLEAAGILVFLIRPFIVLFIGLASGVTGENSSSL